ncbi:MAG: amidophosphoribosyltransferase [Spirochaetes bacterium]|nr:amidophosphoribosyltransferase [Spirochaetota bacterium]
MLSEDCGIFGVYNHSDSVSLTFLGLHSLQHRGQESLGVVYHNRNGFKQLKGMGLVNQFLKNIDLSRHRGRVAIGHTRYSTTGSSSSSNIQPLLINSYKGLIGVAHNGNLINAKMLKDNLRQKGAIFQTALDSEVILHLIAHSREKDLKKAIIASLKKIRGGFAFLFITEKGLCAARDPMGNRPLCLGKKGKSYIVSSEDSALKIVQAHSIREIQPGEIVFLEDDRITSAFFTTAIQKAHCIFELIYFARPDSTLFGLPVNQFREECGKQLARDSSLQADVVIAVPDSGNYAALGFSRESGIPFEMGLVRNHYIGRTFIQAKQLVRENDARLKLMPVENILKNKKVVIVDDSIVRGTTSRKIVKILREARVKEVHFRIASPPYLHPCYYGIDTPDENEFIAHRMDISGIRKFLQVDSLHYLSMNGLKQVLGERKNDFCFACFNGRYPQKVKIKLKKEILE